MEQTDLVAALLKLNVSDVKNKKSFSTGVELVLACLLVSGLGGHVIKPSFLFVTL